MVVVKILSGLRAGPAMRNIRNGMVSTIIPVYNRPRLLVEAVDSVLKQTCDALEIIIVDDGSTDETAAVAEALCAQHPQFVRLVRQPHAGEMHNGWPRALNAGIAESSGEFVQFLDSDDLLMPPKFATQVAALRGDLEAGISYAYAREYAMGDPPPLKPCRRTGETFRTLAPAVFFCRLWPTPAALYRRDVIERNGPFLEIVNSDWEFECRLAVSGVRLNHCRMFLADVRNTQRIEGRRQGNRPRRGYPENLDAHERMLASARAVGAPPSVFEHQARLFFALARDSAAAGFPIESRRAVEQAIALTDSWPRRLSYRTFATAAGRLGSRRAGAAVQSVRGPLLRAATRVRLIYARWQHRLRVVVDTAMTVPWRQWPSAFARLWQSRAGARARS